jgi:hypothetical protein
MLVYAIVLFPYLQMYECWVNDGHRSEEKSDRKYVLGASTVSFVFRLVADAIFISHQGLPFDWWSALHLFAFNGRLLVCPPFIIDLLYIRLYSRYSQQGRSSTDSFFSRFGIPERSLTNE